jgi:hypothetical protein
MSKKSYPRFSPTRIENHSILGTVKVYDIGKYPTPDGDGCQTSFFRNNAETNNPNQFGLKMFNTSVEAFAAYQRQNLAAREGLAPPVGVMVRWIVKNHKGRTVNRWGYETCLADVSDHARKCAQIRGCPIVGKAYAEYYMAYTDGNRRCRPFSKHTVEDFFEFLSDYDQYDGPIDAYSSMSTSVGEGSLRTRLMEISLVGTQYDNLASIYDMGESWSASGRLFLGSVVCEDDDMYMSNDLHRGNLGLWMGNPVVVDFGYHIASPQYREMEYLTEHEFTADKEILV